MEARKQSLTNTFKYQPAASSAKNSSASLVSTGIVVKSSIKDPTNPVILNISRNSITRSQPQQNAKGEGAAATIRKSKENLLEQSTSSNQKPLVIAVDENKKKRSRDMQKRISEFQEADARLTASKRQRSIQNNKLAQPKVADVKDRKNSADKKDERANARCHMTFIFDPNGRLSYWMGKQQNHTYR
jgi:hypothetical protein